MRELVEQYPVVVILESMRRTASVIKKDPALEHHRVVRAAQNICERLLAEAHARGKNLGFKGREQDTSTQPVPKPASEPKDIETVMDNFQAHVSDDGTWSLTEDIAKGLLSKYSVEVLREVMLNLGRYDTEHAAEAVDLLTWLCEQQVLTGSLL